jgi:uncharacterized membrane protein
MKHTQVAPSATINSAWATKAHRIVKPSFFYMDLLLSLLSHIIFVFVTVTLLSKAPFEWEKELISDVFGGYSPNSAIEFLLFAINNMIIILLFWVLLLGHG